MENINRTPVYNLKVVLQETGLKAELLRAWERRYEMPKPQRTAGGHRMYSDYDIALLKWLRARQMEGLSISRAVELWKEISESGRDPLSVHPISVQSEISPALTDNPQMEFLRRNWIRACKRFDTIYAEELINQAFSLYPVEIVCFDLLQKGLNEIGSLWAQNQLSVQQEHFASNLASRRVATLIEMTPNPTRQQTILLGCPEGEWHTFPLLLLNLLLRRKGFNVIYLGASIPLEQWEQTATAIHPNLVILAAQRLDTAISLRQAASLFHTLKIPFAFGGLVFNRIPEIRGGIPANFLGENLEGVPARVEQILTNPIEISVLPDTEKSTRVAAQFRSNKIKIEAVAMEWLQQQGVFIPNLDKVNPLFTSELAAAIEFGNPAYLVHDLDWIQRVMAERDMPTQWLEPYLKAYAAAIASVMGEDGKPIVQWLNSCVQ